MPLETPTTPPHAAPAARLGVGRAYLCQCGLPVFFRNSRCMACGTALGYDPERSQLIAMQPAPEAAEGSNGAGPAPEVETWVRFGDDAGTPLYRRCANFATPAACNWLVGGDARRDAGLAFCRSCRLNRCIPDLSAPRNGERWLRIELAKRRLVSSLIGLGLPVRSRVDEDRERGLAFDLLQALPGGPKLLTGHEDGIVTLDIDEADDARREQTRVAMRERYRTLLGHLRHEVGHYYWQREVEHSEWIEPFRSLFGDERQDYAAALQRHYEAGAPADWELRHVSAYASSHPWEDWAETWAHYLHMVDTLDTATSFGLDTRAGDLVYEPFTDSALHDPNDAGAAEFLAFVNDWVELTGVMNELSRSMGHADFYPFVLSVPAVVKLHFIHRVVASAASRRRNEAGTAP